MNIVITGANRGIGLELARQFLRRGDSVVATARDPSHAQDLRQLIGSSVGRGRVVACDVSQDDSVGQLAAAVGDAPVDLLVNNAGVMGRTHALGGLDFDDVQETLNINAVGALRVATALLPALKRGVGKKIAHISSGMGSIDDNSSGGSYGYRMSKAALNMASRSLAVDLRPLGIISVVLNPGWVRTDMGGRGAPLSVEHSAVGLIRQIDGLTLQQSGLFLDHSGFVWRW